MLGGSKRPLFRQPLSLSSPQHAAPDPNDLLAPAPPPAHTTQDEKAQAQVESGAADCSNGKGARRVLVCRHHMEAFDRGALSLAQTIHARQEQPP